ncbi:MAG: pyrroline-5-carboxylate reductase [Thalassobaculales bacterium]
MAQGGIAGPILLVGCGKMGGAMLSGWLERGVPGPFHVIEPGGAASFAGRANVVADAGDLPGDLKPAVLVLAVKPQYMDEAIAPCARFVGPGTLVVSIAAGKTIAYFRRHLGGGAAVLRAMPNTPAAVGRGITAVVAGPGVTAGQKAAGIDLLEAVGEVVEVPAETDIDIVTALSGGGPAYVFLLIECLAAAGEAQGLPAELAMRLARATVIGSGELARQSAESAAQLRVNVTSPGGTTAEALKVLMAPEAMPALFRKAIAAATERSRELAG